MADELLKRVAATLARHGVIEPGQGRARILVAVSGGPDSVALFWALRELSGELGFSVAVAHLDHGLRGAEAGRDRCFVEDIARSAGVDCITEAVKLSSVRGNKEAAGRIARYRFLQRAAKLTGCSRVATGHTLDDQAETVMLRLMAGAGVQGLAAIAPVRGMLIRPLIDCSRQDVWHFLHSRQYRWRWDRTNYDVRFARNRVRHLVLPLLSQAFNRNLREALARMADLARAENDLLEHLCEEAEASLVSSAGGLRAEGLIELPLALQRRIVRRWIGSLGARRPSAEQVEQVRALATAGGAARSICLGRLRVTCEFGILSGEPERKTAEKIAYCHTIAAGTEVHLPELKLVVTLSRPESLGQAPKPTADVLVADASLLPPTLVLRNRRRGDKLFALGMSGSKGLKEVFREARMPRHLRQRWPILTAAGEILWIPGVARSRFALVSPSTRLVVVGRLRKE